MIRRKLTQAQIKKLQTSPRKTIGRLGVAATKTMTPADKRKAMQKQRLARRKAIQQQKQRVATAKTGLDRRQAKTGLKALKVDKKISRANRKGNIGKVKKLTGKLKSLTERNAALRDHQMAKAGKSLTGRNARLRKLTAMQKADTLMRAKRKG